MKVAEVMIPSVPSFCAPGTPAKNLSVTSLPNPVLRKRAPGASMRRVLTTVSPSSASSWMSNTALSTVWILPKLCPTRSTRIHLPSAPTIFQDSRLSKVVPHSTAFLPPAFMAMLPPTHEASADVGSTPNTSPARAPASSSRRVTTPAPACSTGCRPSKPGSFSHTASWNKSSFSVLITQHSGSKGIAPPV